MKIVVVGGGAMGSIFSSGLAEIGEEVTVLDVAVTLVQQLSESGLTISKDGADTTVRLAVTTDAACLETAELVVIFVKAQHTSAVARTLEEHLNDGATVLSLQNGWGNADVLVGTVPSDRLVMGVTYHSGTVVSPGRVAHTGRGPTFVGPYDQDAELVRSEVVSGVLNRAGFETTATRQVRTEIWNKLVLNAATLPVAAATGLRAGEMLEVPEVAALVDAVAKQAVAVAREFGVPVDEAERLAKIKAVLAGAGQGKPSMLQDVEGRRKTEVEVINGAITRAATDCGVDVPLNQALYAVIKGIERSWTR